MKKVIYSLLLATFTIGFIACEEDLPRANFNLYELKSLTATAGDMNISLKWEDYEEAKPNEYLVIWTVGNNSASGGQLIVEAGQKNAVIENLENDITYTVSVQPRYPEGLAGKTTVGCTPKNARYPVNNFKASAGNERVRLNWEKPVSDLFTTYRITVTPGNRVITLEDKSLQSYLVENLTNGLEYTFSMVTVYPTGNSQPIEAKATPGVIKPILTNDELALWEAATFAWNEMYFMAGEVQAVHWDFGDGTISTENTPVHAYAQTGNYTVTVTVTYTNNVTEKAESNVSVVPYRWSTTDLNFGGLSGYVKTSNPVFSPDGKTVYIPTSTPAGHLFAIDVVSGQIKWSFAINKITYGGGALVDNNGTIYQCVRDKTIDNVYAINPNGSKKWSLLLDAPIGAFPALSAGNILYCLTNKSTLYAIQSSDGTILWEQGLEGSTGSALAIDKTGNIYVGTSSAIYAFTPQKEVLWKLDNVNVTEQGSFALRGGYLYATLKAGGGLIAVNMSTGKQEWTYKNAKGDAYFPIIDKNGVIYFTEKGTNVYAITPQGELKWKKDIGYALTYNGAALSSDGILYVGTNNGKKVVGIDSANGEIVYEEVSGQQIMSSVSIGPDRRLYFGTIGSDNIGSIKALPIDKAHEADSWSMRGNNLQGTNRQDK